MGWVSDPLKTKACCMKPKTGVIHFTNKCSGAQWNKIKLCQNLSDKLKITAPK